LKSNFIIKLHIKLHYFKLHIKLHCNVQLKLHFFKVSFKLHINVHFKLHTSNFKEPCRKILARRTAPELTKNFPVVSTQAELSQKVLQPAHSMLQHRDAVGR